MRARGTHQAGERDAWAATNQSLVDEAWLKEDRIEIPVQIEILIEIEIEIERDIKRDIERDLFNKERERER